MSASATLPNASAAIVAGGMEVAVAGFGGVTGGRLLGFADVCTPLPLAGPGKPRTVVNKVKLVFEPAVAGAQS